jgi:hypothetical protein
LIGFVVVLVDVCVGGSGGGDDRNNYQLMPSIIVFHIIFLQEQ